MSITRYSESAAHNLFGILGNDDLVQFNRLVSDAQECIAIESQCVALDIAIGLSALKYAHAACGSDGSCEESPATSDFIKNTATELTNRSAQRLAVLFKAYENMDSDNIYTRMAAIDKWENETSACFFLENLLKMNECRQLLLETFACADDDF
jgi:hypothetical protein